MTNNIFYSSDFGGNEYEKQHSDGYNRKTIDGKTRRVQPLRGILQI